MNTRIIFAAIIAIVLFYGGCQKSIVEPEPYFHVVRVFPDYGTKDVSNGTDIVIYFSSPVDSTIFSKAQIIPSVKGF